MNLQFQVEQSLLACFTHSSDETLHSISAGLSERDFSTTAHRAIFAAICRLTSEKVPVSLSNVRPLADYGEELRGVFAAEVASGSCRHLTKVVLENSDQRRVRAAIRNAQMLIDDTPQPWSELRSQLTSTLNAALVPTSRAATKSWATICQETHDLITLPSDRGIASPFPLWDQQAGRLMPGDLCVLAARPGRGKSALAAQFASGCLRQNQIPAFFTYEMSESQVIERMLIQSTGSREIKRRLQALTLLPPFPIIGPTIARSIDRIEAYAKLLASTWPNLALVIIDYLQLVEPADSTVPREQQVAAISRRLKLLALELQLPVLLLAQLNRSSEIERREPGLSDLRESGSIEQDADSVWFLHPRGLQNNDAPQDFSLIQAKKRSGRANISKHLVFNPTAVTFALPGE